MEEIGYFTDLHIHAYTGTGDPERRLATTIRCLENICAQAAQRGITLLLFGGDLFDQQKALPTRVVNATLAAFSGIFARHRDLCVLAISGNHDQASKNLPHQPAVTALSHLAEAFPKRFVLLDGDFFNFQYEDFSIAGIPYYPHKEHFDAALDKAAEREYTTERVILLVHQTPKGTSPTIPWEIDPEDPRLDAFAHVWCGHIHRQSVRPCFVVGGSPLHRDAGDIGTGPKGWWVQSLRDLSVEFVPLKGYPEFVTVRSSEEEEAAIRVGNYPVRDFAEIDTPMREGAASSAQFGAALRRDDLLRNYHRAQATGEALSEECLSVGLSLLQP